MDPVSHAAVGYIAVRSVWWPTPRLAATACLGALAPDMDALFMPFGWDVYLRIHEIGTHALVGVLPVALATALITRGRTRAPLGPLVAAACIAVLSHLALDVVSGARIRLGWPLVDGRTLVPLVAMAELWVLGLSVLGVVALARFKSQASGVARSVLVVLAVGLSMKALWLRRALETLPAPSADTTRVVEARWATINEWSVFSRTGTRLAQLSVAPGRAPRVLAEWPLASDFPLALQSRQLADVRNLLAVHELAFARQHPTIGGQTEVLWSDIRFCWKPQQDEGGMSGGGPAVIGSGPLRIACGLWVGGTYDRSGHAINQRVQVFGVWQTRPAPQ